MELKARKLTGVYLTNELLEDDQAYRKVFWEQYQRAYAELFGDGSVVMEKPTHRLLDDGTWEVDYTFTVLGPMIGEGI